MMPGFGELMRSKSLTYVPTAILSRQTAGIRNKTLIVNLPGKPKAIRQCLDAVFPAIPYCIDLLEGPFIECNEEVIKPFRPQNV
jgi:molybdopterin adenylyltransferase